MIEKFDPLKGEMLRILHSDGRLDETLRPDLSDGGANFLGKKITHFSRHAPDGCIRNTQLAGRSV